MMISKEKMYVSDIPIENENEDILDRKEFVNALADSLINYQSSDSLVVGLYGEWGSGKTSILNMVQNQIMSKTAELDQERRPIVFYFKPWNFSNANQLLQNFFDDLIYSIEFDKSNIWNGWKEDFRKYAQKVLPFLDVAEPLVSLFANATPWTKTGLEVGKQVIKYAAEQPSLSMLRDKLIEKLKEKNRKIVIFMDDIDRLDADQVMMVFRLVKQLVDFPNVLYVLAMDKGIVAEIVNKSQGIDGKKYLEKVVQVPIVVPQINPEVLVQYINDAFLKIYGNSWALDVRYRSMLYDGVLPVLHNLRDCKRLIDDFEFRSYSLISAEKKDLLFNPVDLLGLCAISALDLGFVSYIYQSKETLCGAEKDLTDFEKDQMSFLKSKLKDIPNDKQINSILAILFPRWAKYADVYIPVQIPNDADSIILDSRIADINTFDLYFRLSQSAYPVSKSRAKEFTLSDLDEMKEILKTQRMAQDVNVFFLYLKSVAKQELVSRKQDIIAALYQARSILCVSNINQMNADTSFVFSAERCGGELLWNSRMKENEQYDTLRLVLESADIYTLSGQVSYDLLALLQNSGNFNSPSNRGLQIEDLNKRSRSIPEKEQLFRCYVERLKQEAQNGGLWKLQCFDHVLILWEGIDKQSYVDTMKAQLKDTYHKLLFLCGTIIPQTVGRYAPRYPYNYKQYEDVLAFDAARQAVQEFEDQIGQYYPGRGQNALNEYQLRELAFVKLQLRDGSEFAIQPEEVEAVLKAWNGKIQNEST